MVKKGDEVRDSTARRVKVRRRAATMVVGAVLAQVVAVVATVGYTAQPAYAAPGPEPLLTMYVPLAENDYITALRTGTGLPGDIGTSAYSTISITVAASGAVLYYDQWENGFEATINDRTQVSGAGATQVWGDGDLTNGDVTPFCAACSGDLIPAGGVITLNNTRRPGTSTTVGPVPVAIPLTGTPLQRNSAEVYWDGRDKIASTRGIALSNAGWGQANALASGAVSAFDTSRWGTSYVIPVGTDSPRPVSNSTPTEYTGVSVMAGQDATTVQIDANADGDVADPGDVDTVLDQGETVLVDGNVRQGATVNASRPVQAELYVADIGANYEVSFVELFPTNQLTSSYIVPASSYAANQSTVVYLFNPYTTLLYIDVQTSSGTTSYSVPARTSRPIILNAPLGSAALLTSSRAFTATALVGPNAPDSGSGNNTQDYDWGFAPLPTDYLTPAVVVGWAPAYQPGFTPDLNASPVWVTASSATTVYVDFDGNPLTGANTVPNTGACGGVDRYDTAVAVPALQSLRITDTTAGGSPTNDGDMTGARLFTCDGTEIAAAYGEDPLNAPVGTPGLDLGTAILPATAMIVQKDWALSGDEDGDGVPDPGDDVQWSIGISDAGATALTNTVATDPLPAGVAYVAGSTTIDLGTGPVPVPDHAVPPFSTPFPLDEGGYAIGTIAPGATVTLAFRTTIDKPFLSADGRVTNVVTVTSDQANGTGSADLTPNAPRLFVYKTSDAGVPLEPGDPLTYTLTVGNNGAATLDDIAVTDPLPAALTWQSTQVTRPVDQTSGTIADDFQCTTYSCSSGSVAWSQTSWAEQNDSATAPVYQTGGIRNVVDGTANALRVGCTGGGCSTSTNLSISRIAGNLTSYEKVSVGLARRCSGFDGGVGDDAVTLEVRPDAGAAWSTVATWGGTACNSASYVNESYDLSVGSQIGNATELRFRVAQATENNDLFFADTVTLSLIDRVDQLVAGAAPPALTTLPSLLPGETATIVVASTVNNPLPPGTLDVVNTATVASGPLSDDDGVTDCVACFDFGDAPDDYGTLLGTNGARARYRPTGPRLGAALDREADAWAAANRTTPATGDDTHELDDEDGVIINGGAGLAGGTTATVTFTASNLPVGGWFNGWIDFDNDGTFDAGESIFEPGVFVSATGGLGSNGYVPADGTYTVTIDVPNFETNGSGYAINDLVYSRFRLTSVAGGATSPTGLSSDGEVEDYSTVLSSLPVELAHFSARPGKGGVTVTWRTAQEVDNLGFNLYADRGVEEPALLTSTLIPSESPTSTSSQSYKATVATSATALWLESVDLDGTPRRHGPFTVGSSWGDPKPPKPIDWAAAGDAVEASTPAPAPVKATASTTGAVADLEVGEAGLYRLTGAELRAAGVDLTGVARGKVALTRDGVPVPVKVTGGATVSDATVITFWGEPADTLYSDVAVYQIQIDRKLSVAMANDATPVPAGAPVPGFIDTAELEVQRGYSVTAPGDDPWYDQLLSARRAPRSVQRVLTVSNLVPGLSDSVIGVDVWGLSRFPQVDEHHVRVAVNGQTVLDRRFDDDEAPTLEAPVPSTLLVNGDNTVTVTLVGDTGVPLDLIALDKIALRYPRGTAADAGGLRVVDTAGPVQVTGLTTADVTALRLDGGVPRILTRAKAKADPAGGFTITVPGSAEVAVVPASGVKRPEVTPARPAADLLRGPADYLVITHGAFVDELGPLTAHHEARGRRVKVVDVADVYQRYGGGMVDAAAIDEYVAEAKRALGVQWVLLVGADSYDYLDHDGDGSFSLLPSPYGPVGLGGVRFAPLDPAYADVDGDDVPDVALGRLPARTPDELAAMIAKTVAYAERSSASPPSALLVADAADGLDFSTVNDELQSTLTGWQISRSDIGVQGVAGARASLLGGLATSPSLTSYIGHSGVREWGPAGFFAAKDVAAAPGDPTVVAQYGCWNTYYVQPSADTLAHELLLVPGGGAAMVMGGVTLTSATSDVLYAKVASARFAAGGGTYGEAVLAAKRDLAADHAGLTEIQLGWTVLGDPALPLPRG